MCGIIGISEGNRENLISNGINTISYRGPDDNGIFSNTKVTFGHLRLSIIDLSPLGHQPMLRNENIISFNGEIYNYKDLRKNLEERGVRFVGNSDTEVILEGYNLEGKSFFQKLRGMWAFAIYDSQKKKIILSRDHFGIKPLYYIIKNNLIYFASEVKALKKIVGPFTSNTEKYFEFYNLGYFIGEDTCFKEVKKVLPGEILTWDLEKYDLKKEFLLLEAVVKRENLDFSVAVNLVEDSIKESVEKHYIADVEVGLLLSGGTDSSLIAALSKNLGRSPTCYHISVPNGIDTEYTRKVSDFLGFKLVEKELSKKSLEEEYQNLKDWIDQPTSDLSIIPTALVYKSIPKNNKVVLSGEGGDELFGGYLRHQALASIDKISISSNFINSLYSANYFGLNYLNPILRRIEERVASNIIDVYLRNSKTLGFPIEENKIKEELLGFYNKHPHKYLGPPNLFFDQFMYLSDSLLYKNDTASMLSSTEARVPLVDKEVLKVSSSISHEFRLSPGYTNKKILKTILKKYLPENLVDRPKKGFGFSFESFEADFFVDDYKKASKFHIENGLELSVNFNLKKIFSESNAQLICRKFPRFAFSIITNWMVMMN